MRFHKLQEDLAAGTSATLREDISLTDLWINRIQQAQKFYLGSCSALPDAGSIKPKAIPRLPYSLCAFEFLEDFEDETFNVICIAEENEPPNEERSTYVAVFLGSSPMGFRFLGKFITPPPGGDNFVIASPVSVAREPEAIRKSISNMISRFAWGTLTAVRVINCSNVQTTSIQPPLPLNKKRIANGKPPIYEYKVLSLRPGQSHKGDLGGTHASPRVHLRRGHIKRRKTGDFWWQPHVAGNPKKGIVVKDYDASRL